MRLITKTVVDEYLKSDRILDLIRAARKQGDDDLTCQRWLLESPAKRSIYLGLYGDLLMSSGRRVLDVGGGLTSLTRSLATRHEYTLIDLMAHDDALRVREFADATPGAKYHLEDWFTAPLGDRYDVVIANDLFPNVDQRLDLFLGKVLPRAREVRLSLTYYNAPRFYNTKRIDADELLCMLAWDGSATGACLKPYADRIADARIDLLSVDYESPFPNGRQVCVTVLAGDLG